MPSQVAGNLVLDSWEVLDAASLPLTGMLVPGDVVLSLYRQSGSAMIAASETVAWTEIGATGRYYFSFTPQNTGLYLLHLKEVQPLSLLRTTEFRYDILAAGAVNAPSYANAFCAETDIERWLQQAISATSQPSDTQATAFAEAAAAVLMSLCAGLGHTVTPSTVVAGSRLEDLLREANAIRAAMDYTIAQSFKSGGSKTERAEALLNLWVEYYGGPMPGFVTARVGLIEQEIRRNTVSLATSHVLSRDTTARADEGAPQDVGLQVKMDSVY